MNYNIKIGHIYPDLLDMYGDKGNIASLSKRLIWRGMGAEIVSFKKNDTLNLEDVDILLIGGGDDTALEKALTLLSNYKKELKNYVEDGGVLLALCGAFPMLGKNMLDILNIYTEKSEKRFTGNVVIENEELGSIVGFENHKEKTYIGNLSPLGKVVKGFGNCGDGMEGVIYKNTFATFLHGPLLPKNPHLADEIIKRALEKKYGGEISLPPLDDSLENDAHKSALSL